MSELTRPLAATVSLLCLWFIAMILEAMRAPAWALAMSCGLLLGNVIVLAASVLDATREQNGGGGDGGRPLRDPDRPEPGSGGDPIWWPELERYLAERERDERSPERAPVGV